MTKDLGAIDQRRKGAIAWMACTAMAAAYVYCITRLTSFPMQDYANHVARADVMADLLFHHGTRFGAVFQVHLMPVPYVLPDLILTSAIELFGIPIGTGLFSTLVLLSLPCALLLYARSCAMPSAVRPFLFLLGLYLTLDWFFIAGFMAFRLALAVIVATLALAEILRKRWSTAGFIGYLAMLVVGYLTHLTVPVFLVAAIGAAGAIRVWFKTSTIRVEVSLLAPILVLLAAYFGDAAQIHVTAAADIPSWAGPGGSIPLINKIRNLRDDFIGFDRQVVVFTSLLFAACMLWPVRRELNLRTVRKPAVVEQLALIAAFLTVYFVLPYQSKYSLYVDIRALPMISLMVLFTCLRLPSEDSTGRAFGNSFTFGLAAVLATAQLVYVIVPLNTNDAWIARYRQILSSVPAGSYVLPVHTQTSRPYLVHAASHLVLDRSAVFPYLFNANFGDPMSYFSYKSQRYMPDSQWYRTQLHGGAQAVNASVDWHRVACDYDFLVITMPYDPALVGVPTALVSSNETGAVLAVNKQACATGSTSH